MARRGRRSARCRRPASAPTRDGVPAHRRMLQRRAAGAPGRGRGPRPGARAAMIRAATWTEEGEMDTLSVCLAGATGWTGRALVPAIAGAPDLVLRSAVSRSTAGRDLGEAL